MTTFGMRVWAPDGVTLLTDVTDRLTKVYGTYTASITPSSPNPVVVPASGVNASGSYFAIANSAVAMVTLGTNVINVYWLVLGTYSLPITVFHC
jgi:hypothetical protein